SCCRRAPPGDRSCGPRWAARGASRTGSRGFRAKRPARRPRRPRARRRRCESCTHQLLGPGVIAILVVASDLVAVLLRDLLHQERGAALRAALRDRPVPQHELAIGIVRAPEEHLAAAGPPLDDLAALVGILRARNSRRLVPDVPAGRVVRAGGELTEAPLL